MKNRVAFLLLSLFLTGTSLFAQEKLSLTYTLRQDSETVLSLRIFPFPTEEVIFALNQGFQSELRVTLRLMRKQTGLLSIFGDILEWENSYSMIGELDRFKSEFILQTFRGGQLAFTAENVFISSFARISGLEIDIPQDAPTSDFYLEARAKITPIRLVSPLGILDLFSGDYKYETPTLRIPLNGSSGSEDG